MERRSEFEEKRFQTASADVLPECQAKLRPTCRMFCSSLRAAAGPKPFTYGSFDMISAN